MEVQTIKRKNIPFEKVIEIKQIRANTFGD